MSCALYNACLPVAAGSGPCEVSVIVPVGVGQLQTEALLFHLKGSAKKTCMFVTVVSFLLNCPAPKEAHHLLSLATCFF